MKRNPVVYDDLVAKWAVVDAKAAGTVIEFPAQETAAQNATQCEETVWPEAYRQAD